MNPDRIDRELHFLEAEVEGLLVADADWNTTSEALQDSYAVEWMNDVGGLEILERHRVSGALSGSQTNRFNLLKARLRELLPTIDRLGLSRPNFDL